MRILAHSLRDTRRFGTMVAPRQVWLLAVLAVIMAVGMQPVQAAVSAGCTVSDGVLLDCDDYVGGGDLDFYLAGITSIAPGAFDGMANPESVTELHLDANGLVTLPAGLFDKLTGLTTLYGGGGAAVATHHRPVHESHVHPSVAVAALPCYLQRLWQGVPPWPRGGVSFHRCVRPCPPPPSYPALKHTTTAGACSRISWWPSLPASSTSSLS